MTVFIPAWGSVSNDNLSTDELMGQLLSFSEYDQNYNILISSYIPQLRYFLHRFNLLESPYQSVFDSLQGFEALEQRPLRLEDLSFPKFVTFYSAISGFWVYEKGQLVGRVITGEGLQIFEVQHFKEEILTHVEVYDDRGVLSSCRYYAEGEETHTEYLDKEGRGIFTCDSQTGVCLVNQKNSKGLKQREYETLEAIAWEKINTYLSQGDEEKIVVSLTDQNLPFISQSPHLPQMTLSFFGTRYGYAQTQTSLLHKTLNGARTLLVDSSENFKKVSLICLKDIYRLTPFDTRFTLSATQEMKEEVLFVEMKKLSLSDISTLLWQLIQYMLKSLRLSEQRSFKIILNTSWEKEGEIKDVLKALLREAFPQEVELLEKGIMDANSENKVDQDYFITQYPNFFLVEQLWKSFEVKMIHADDEIFKIIHETRVIIDVSSSPDLFLQITGISAGIPHINTVSSEYVGHEENGYIVRSMEEVEWALEYYLESFKYWNVARVFSIDQIKKYSGVALYQELCQILGEK